MTEQELRTLVRDAIARHNVSGNASTAFPGGAGAPSHLVPPGAPPHLRTLAPSPDAAPHAALFVLPSGPEGSCIIEPAVRCNHCGYCKSYGH